MSGKVGFACKFMHEDQSLQPKILKEMQQPLNYRATTIKWLNEHKTQADDRLRELVMHNLAATYKLVKYVSTLPENQRMVRLGSDMLPAYTEKYWSGFYKDNGIKTIIERELAKVGEFARQHGVRLSFHPGQFTVLASDNPDIVDNSIKEFEYHADMARYMGYGKSFQDFKINVHISGRLGPDGIRDAYRRLSPEARNTITIENEENKWGLEDCLELGDILPIVLDIHHHFVNSGTYIQATDDRYKRVIESWRGVRPAMHYSQSREDYLINHDPEVLPDMEQLLSQGYKKGKLRAHSDYMWNNAVNEWAKTFLDYADIMIEAKCKNLASKQFVEQ
jgi:UV DNA damage endonuclease